MKQLDASSRDQWMDARVESYVDGDLSGEEQMQFERILEEDDYWKTQIQQARRIQDTIYPRTDVSRPPTPSVVERPAPAGNADVARPRGCPSASRR